jgi:hypothetical protein
VVEWDEVNQVGRREVVCFAYVDKKWVFVSAVAPRRSKDRLGFSWPGGQFTVLAPTVS